MRICIFVALNIYSPFMPIAAPRQSHIGHVRRLHRYHYLHDIVWRLVIAWQHILIGHNIPFEHWRPKLVSMQNSVLWTPAHSLNHVRITPAQKLDTDKISKWFPFDFNWFQCQLSRTRTKPTAYRRWLHPYSANLVLSDATTECSRSIPWNLRIWPINHEIRERGRKQKMKKSKRRLHYTEQTKMESR